MSVFTVLVERNEGRQRGGEEREELYARNASGIVIARGTCNSKGRIPWAKDISGQSLRFSLYSDQVESDT